jgi:hypothetical protein
MIKSKKPAKKKFAPSPNGRPTIGDLTKERFGLYHAHIYLLNDAGDTLDLVAGADETGRKMVAEGWQIPLDQGQSLGRWRGRLVRSRTFPVGDYQPG